MTSASSQIEQLRQQLFTLLNSSDPYPFLSVVEDSLAAVPDDDQIRAQAVRLLTDKGLYQVAAEIAQGCPAESPNARVLHEAASQFAQQRRDLVDPIECDDRMASNLEALRARDARHQALAESIANSWRTGGGDLTLYRANDGNFQVRAVRSDGRRIWVPAVLDFAGQIEMVAKDDESKVNIPAPFLVDGVGLGWLVPRLHAATARTFLTYSAAIFVVELNLRALAVVLRLHDWSAILADERVYLFAGPDAWKQWQEFMRQEPLLSSPSEITVLPHWPGAPVSRVEQACQEVIQQRDEAYARQFERANRYYQGRDLALWAKRYESADVTDPLRILGVTTRYSTFLQHSTRDMMVAFQHAGARTKLLIEPHDHALLTRQTYMKALADFKPDLIFSIDHHRHEFPGRYPANVPYVCWIQDPMPHLFVSDTGSHMGPLDFTIGFGRPQCVRQCGYPAERFMTCKMAVLADKFSGIGAGDTELDEVPRCDVAYISHHSEPPAALHERVRQIIDNPEIRHLVDVFYEETRPLLTAPRFNAAFDLDALLRQAEVKSGIMCEDMESRRQVMMGYVNPLADRTIRHTTLEWVADWADAMGRTFHLYGRGWERHPRFSRYSKGPAKHGHHLAQISRQATINLHTGMAFALHQRVLETVAADGFLMIRYNPYDFEAPIKEGLQQYLIEHGIDSPTRIPIDRLPEEYVKTWQQWYRDAGRSIPDHIEITVETLLGYSARYKEDIRYNFSDLAFPELDQITFDSPEAFAERAEHFINNVDDRQRITCQMHSAVKELFTYDALALRLIRFIRRQLHAQTE